MSSPSVRHCFPTASNRGEGAAKTKLTVSASITSLKFLFPAILFLMALTASLGLQEKCVSLTGFHHDTEAL